jgi:hypothetical protein
VLGWLWALWNLGLGCCLPLGLGSCDSSSSTRLGKFSGSSLSSQDLGAQIPKKARAAPPSRAHAGKLGNILLDGLVPKSKPVKEPRWWPIRLGGQPAL